MRITPEALQQDFTLTTAATRLDFLSRRDNGETALNRVQQVDDDDWASLRSESTQLDVYESLELLALGEVIARKAHDSRLVGIRAALRGGASWEQIAEALGSTPEQAWDDFAAAVTEELDADAADSARQLAGARPAG
jgi:hypothetical protein